MKKKVLVSLIVVAAGVLGYTFIRSNTANAPAIKNEPTKPAAKVTQPQTQDPQSITNNTNDKKTMGLEIKTTQEGTGERVVKSGDTIAVHYTGKLTDGTKFDSSVDRGTPFEFQIGQGMVIQGWEQGFLGAKVGEKRTLTIPAELGYGSRGAGAVIPPNATLIFDVELISIK